MKYYVVGRVAAWMLFLVEIPVRTLAVLCNWLLAAGDLFIAHCMLLP